MSTLTNSATVSASTFTPTASTFTVRINFRSLKASDKQGAKKAKQFQLAGGPVNKSEKGKFFASCAFVLEKNGEQSLLPMVSYKSEVVIPDAFKAVWSFMDEAAKAATLSTFPAQYKEVPVSLDKWKEIAKGLHANVDLYRVNYYFDLSEEIIGEMKAKGSGSLKVTFDLTQVAKPSQFASSVQGANGVYSAFSLFLNPSSIEVGASVSAGLTPDEQLVADVLAAAEEKFGSAQTSTGYTAEYVKAGDDKAYLQTPLKMGKKGHLIHVQYLLANKEEKNELFDHALESLEALAASADSNFKESRLIEILKENGIERSVVPTTIEAEAASAEISQESEEYFDLSEISLD